MSLSYGKTVKIVIFDFSFIYHELHFLNNNLRISPENIGFMCQTFFREFYIKFYERFLYAYPCYRCWSIVIKSSYSWVYFCLNWHTLPPKLLLKNRGLTMLWFWFCTYAVATPFISELVIMEVGVELNYVWYSRCLLEGFSSELWRLSQAQCKWLMDFWPTMFYWGGSQLFVVLIIPIKKTNTFSLEILVAACHELWDSVFLGS